MFEQTLLTWSPIYPASNLEKEQYIPCTVSVNLPDTISLAVTEQTVLIYATWYNKLMQIARAIGRILPLTFFSFSSSTCFLKHTPWTLHSKKVGCSLNIWRYLQKIKPILQEGPYSNCIGRTNNDLKGYFTLCHPEVVISRERNKVSLKPKSQS